MNRKSKEFLDLQKQWYKKLERSGFEDIEVLVDGELHLKQDAKHMYAGEQAPVRTLKGDAKQRYFELLGQKLADCREFKRPVDRVIMVLLAEGYQIKEICQRLKEMGLQPRHRETVRYIVRHYENEWGIRKWTPKELNKPDTE